MKMHLATSIRSNASLLKAALLLIVLVSSFPQTGWAAAGTCFHVLQEHSAVISLITDSKTLAKLSKIESQIISGPAEEWHDGMQSILPSQARKLSTIEALSTNEKKYLLAGLKKNPQFQNLPPSYQQLIRMSLNDLESWSQWIKTIHRYGMNAKTPQAFRNTIKQMPEPVRRELVRQIGGFYGDKTYKEFMPLLERGLSRNPNLNIFTEQEKADISQFWEHPKRIYDNLIPMLTQGPQILRKNLIAGMPGIEAYNIYLKQLSEWMNSTTYSAEDVLHTSRAMQVKLKEILKDPQYLEAPSFLSGLIKQIKQNEAYIIIYGSFPNGRANFESGSDIDLAVSYEKLAKGDHNKGKATIGFFKPRHLSTWEIEEAAIDVLSARLGIKNFYDPQKHRVITERKMFNENLAELSPVRLRISAGRIEILVDDSSGDGLWAKAFRGETITAELE